MKHGTGAIPSDMPFWVGGPHIQIKSAPIQEKKTVERWCKLFHGRRQPQSRICGSISSEAAFQVAVMSSKLSLALPHGFIMRCVSGERKDERPVAIEKATANSGFEFPICGNADMSVSRYGATRIYIMVYIRCRGPHLIHTGAAWSPTLSASYPPVRHCGLARQWCSRRWERGSSAHEGTRSPLQMTQGASRNR
jgi:hypothetical protein